MACPPNNFALVTAIVVTFGRIEDHYWFGVLALILPVWVYVVLIDFGGVEWARAYRFPVFFLYFSLPVEPLIYGWADTFLQELTADLAYVFLTFDRLSREILECPYALFQRVLCHRR